MVPDLRKCCSEDDLPTAPWRFLLSFIPFLVLLYSFSKVRISPKVTISLLWLLLITSRKTWLARDIISKVARETVADAFVYTLLHHELRDYSLGQIAFAVFRALFAITQLLWHVSVLPDNRHNYYTSARNILCAW